MAREFSVGLGSAAIQGSLTLVQLGMPAGPNITVECLRFWIGQSCTTTSAQQQVQVHTQVSPFATVTSATPAKLKRGDPTASILVGSTTGVGATAGVNSSTDSSGAQTVIFADAFNVLNGWLNVPTPAETITLPAGYASDLGLKMPVAPTGGFTTQWSFGINYRET